MAGKLQIRVHRFRVARRLSITVVNGGVWPLIFCGLSPVACDRGRESAHLGICHGLAFPEVMWLSGYLYLVHEEPGEWSHTDKSHKYYRSSNDPTQLS